MQNFKNHGQIVPLYHYGLYLLVALILGGSIVNFVHNWRNPHLHFGAILFVVISLALLLIAWYTRSFALRAQDRAIRAEENLRHFVLSGKLLDNRLSIRQIIALRFAPDEEFVALAKKAADSNMANKDIKLAIINWKEDNYRV
ncbi:MAG: DUF6526 family protein [Bacteroidota bacterium]